MNRDNGEYPHIFTDVQLYISFLIYFKLPEPVCMAEDMAYTLKQVE